MPKFEHTFNLAFIVKTGRKDWLKISAEEIIAALETRLAYVKSHKENTHEICGCSSGMPEEDSLEDLEDFMAEQDITDPAEGRAEYVRFCRSESGRPFED